MKLKRIDAGRRVVCSRRWYEYTPPGSDTTDYCIQDMCPGESFHHSYDNPMHKDGAIIHPRSIGSIHFMQSISVQFLRIIIKLTSTGIFPIRPGAPISGPHPWLSFYKLSVGENSVVTHRKATKNRIMHLWVYFLHCQNSLEGMKKTFLCLIGILFYSGLFSQDSLTRITGRTELL